MAAAMRRPALAIPRPFIPSALSDVRGEAGRFPRVAVRQVAELERAVGHADQPVHRKAEMAKHVADLAVLALTHRKSQPDVGALLAVKRRLDRAVADPVNLDAAAERVELRLSDLAMGA